MLTNIKHWIKAPVFEGDEDKVTRGNSSKYYFVDIYHGSQCLRNICAD